MTIGSHIKGLEGCYNKMKGDAETNGRTKMSDEEFEREIVEFKEHLSTMMKLLQKRKEEDQ